MRLVVLVSGTGTILEAIIGAGIPVALVVSDRFCPAIEQAETAGVEAAIVARENFGAHFDRHAYTVRLTSLLEEAAIDLVAMAGFGTILAAPIYDRYAGRILNTHPSLLPAFPGWHAVEDALAHGVKMTGCTVHQATLAVDSGPILAQEAVAVLPDDDAASLHERIKAVERRLYVEVITRVMADQPVVAR